MTDPGDAAVVSDADARQRRVEVADLDRPAGAPTDESVHGLPVLADEDHPLVPSVDHSYIERTVRDGRTDVALAATFLADPEYALLLTGDTGVGKDRLVRQLCAETNRPLVRVNFGAGTTYADLVGEYAPNAGADQDRIERARDLAAANDIPLGEAAALVGAEDAFRFRPGVLYQAVRHGWTFVADELNAASPSATMPLHGLTERAGKLVVQATAEVLEPHPAFRFVATVNPPRYAGTSPLNDAFRSRFWELELDYLPPESERQLLYETTALDPDVEADRRVAERLTELAANLRVNYRERDLATPTSHRAVIKVGRLVSEFEMSPAAAARQVLETRAATEDRNAIAKAIESTRW